MTDEMAPGSGEPSRSGPRDAAGRWDPLKLAAKAHQGQTDKGGEPYIGHCLHVAHDAYETARVEGWSVGFALRCYRVGLLHDVLEDCEWATVEMVEEAISGIDAQAVVRLTKKPGQDRQEYIEAISRNQMTSIVKRCDLAHNMDLSRIPDITKRDEARCARYLKEYRFLLEAARSEREDTQPKATPNTETE